MALLLFKATLFFAIVFAVLPFLRRSSSVTRHLICACSMAGALLLPLTLLAPVHAAPIRLSSITFLTTATAESGSAAWSLVKTLAGLWIAGTLLFLLRLAVGYWRLSRVLRAATPSDEDGASVVLGDVSVPMVAGLLRPVILMPRGSDAWPVWQRAAALHHERAHVQRKDLWTSLIAQLTCAVYWFHPLAWAVAQQQRREQESACDDAVLCSGFEPASYAEALIATARKITSTSLIGCHMTQLPLKSRIARLLENGMPRMSSAATLRRTATLFLAIAAIIALLNGNPKVRAAEEKAVAAVAPAAAQAASPTAEPAPASAPTPAATPVAEQKPAPPQRVYQMEDGITPPKLTYHADPDYTDEAKAAKISGAVRLSMVVGTDGMAHDINVVSGIDSGLDANAIAAVQKWQFEPGTKDGEPVAVRAQVEVNFRLQ